MIPLIITIFLLLAYSTVLWVGIKMFASAKDDPFYSFFVNMGQSFAKVKLKNISYFTVLVFFLLFLVLAPVAFVILFFHFLKVLIVKIYSSIGKLIRIRIKFVKVQTDEKSI